MIVVALILSLPFIVVLATRPVLRRLALRNAVRRPRETLLVIAGSMLATALMTAAFVVGDTFDASLRANAYTQLGPIDEAVSVPLAQAHALDGVAALRAPDVDGVLRVTTVRASAAMLDANGTARAAAPKGQLIEADFAAAARFGGDAKSVGVSGPTPAPGETVLTAPLATKLGARVGDEVTLFPFERPLVVRVVRIVPQVGVAGWWNAREFVSYNAFVAPGTIAHAAAGGLNGAAPPQANVLVSNVGGVESGAAHTASVVREMQRALGGAPVRVATVKQDLLDAATQAGKNLTQLYQTLGFFAVAAGILLLVNIFLMLADERRSELGMLRAMGLKRRALVGAFASEGWLYAIVACLVGMLAGLGVGRLVMAGAERIFNGREADFRLPIRFHFTGRSLQAGFTLGLLIAVLTVVFTSLATSRFNIIAAIRDLERPERTHRRAVAYLLRFVFSLTAAATLAGVRAHAVVPMLLFGALAMLTLRFGWRDTVPDRPIVTTTALGALAWGVVAVPLATALGSDLPIAGFMFQGLILVISAVALVSEYQGEIGGALSRLSGRHLAVRLGLAYPLARRARTALTLAQFAIVVFILVYISVISSMFRGQIDSLSAKLGGGSNVLVDSESSTALPWSEMHTTVGAQAVAPLLVSQQAWITTQHGDAKPTRYQMSGFDDSFLAIGAPKLSDRGAFSTDADAYRFVLTHPDTAMVDDFFLSRGAGPPQAQVKIGDSITVAPPTGMPHQLRVVAKMQNDWLNNGGVTSAATMRSIFGASAVASRAYVRAADPSALASVVEARYYRQGAKADPIHKLVEDRLSRQTQFFTLMRAFLAVGLVIGVAGIGVIMVRAVRERRRQVGVLRSLGFPAAQVSNAFAIEALFVAFEGVLIGIVLGCVCSWSITLSSGFGEGLQFRIPALAILLLVAGTIVGALIATFGPARSASRIKPAVALRIAD